MMRDFLCVSTAVMDEVHPFGHEDAVHLDPGGAGLYAYAGMRIWTDSVSLCAGKGTDFSLSLEKWFRENGADTSAMYEVAEPTPRTIVRYEEDGERTENPKFGSEHYQLFVADCEKIEKNISGVKGVYIFKEANKDEKFWREMIALRNKYHFTLMWEISADTTIPENVEFIKRVAPFVDIFSINRTETKHMLGCTDDGCIEALREIGFPLVFFRRGKEGSVLITKDETVIGLPVDALGVVDPTGAGNSSTGAVLVGRAYGKTLPEIAAMSSISSAFIISRPGVPMVGAPGVREKAEELLEERMEGRI